MYGSLHTFSGPMFSGKTSALLKEYLWMSQLPCEILLIKPSFDNRYSETEVSTHTGVKIKAYNVASEFDIEDLIWTSNKPTPDSVFIDEAQFFTIRYFDSNIPFHQIVQRMLSDGINVYACGLDMDFQGNPFEVMANLLAMSDYVEKLKSTCVISGGIASKTFKKTTSNSRYELGENDIYEPRSNSHWRPK
jgi:thymidine kinase